jgi:hypothetical protein
MMELLAPIFELLMTQFITIKKPIVFDDMSSSFFAEHRNVAP